LFSFALQTLVAGDVGKNVVYEDVVLMTATGVAIAATAAMSDNRKTVG